MSIKVIDCTLRDGSHSIDYKFDSVLTRKILVGLEKAGIKWIEMGHGRGLGASKRSNKPASLTDEEYISLAKDCLKEAKFGFLCQKKFATKDDIKMASEKGLDFIRVATNITEADKVEDFIKFAKEQGLIVFIALMKVHTIPNMSEYIDILEKLQIWGADLATLMDSTGTLLPEDVQRYINFAKTNVKLEIGFHAHNNLQLGISNVISAIKAGVDAVDVSIGGLGRSAGNAPTEILALMMKKYGWADWLDYKILSELNDQIIFPLIKGENRFSSKAITFGFAGFHSNFFPLIEKINKKYPQIDYRDIILEVSKIEQTNLTEEIVEKAASKLLDKQNKIK